ncbi:MAG: BON domain-containing protein [Roseibium album]|uniref:BON domain-containing protein n=1 Tax=Roseibium album TaxID=311410 RepID=UPI0032F0551C
MKRFVRAPAMPLLAVLLMTGVVVNSGCQSYREGTSRTVGEFTDDVGIQSRVKLALLNDPDVKGLRINTEVKRGIVTLFGRVSSNELKERAIGLAAGVKGVKRVEDRLSVVTE